MGLSWDKVFPPSATTVGSHTKISGARGHLKHSMGCPIKMGLLREKIQLVSLPYLTMEDMWWRFVCVMEGGFFLEGVMK